jgi:hypothetical protein
MLSASYQRALDLYGIYSSFLSGADSDGRFQRALVRIP